jgi:YD repeat-containing protein
LTATDPQNHTITYTYDLLGRITQFMSPDSSIQILTVTDPQNHTITYTYDLLGRITQFMSPDSSIISYSYDDTNNKMVSQSGGGYERIFWFDWLSRLTKVEEEYETDLFAVTIYQYDDGSHVHSFTDAENHATHYSYGSLFGLTRITYSDSTCEEYAYDGVGNLVSRTDAEGNTTYFLYDALHRIAQIQYQDQSCVDFMYDLNSNRIRMDDNSPNLG